MKKDFDCVEMKHKIQAKLHEDRKKYASDLEYFKAIRQELKKDPRFSKYYKNS